MSRTNEHVTLEEARRRLIAFRDSQRHAQLWTASGLANVIWPKNEFLNGQGAGAAASRVLKRLGVRWERRQHSWGYNLQNLGD